MFKSTKRIAAAGLALGLSIGAGAAFAAWTTNSEPWVKATTATMKHPEVSAEVVGHLYPGYANDVQGSICNGNPVDVMVSGVTNTGYRNPSTDHIAQYLRATHDPNALNGKVVKAGTCLPFELANAVGLSPNAEDTDQGRTIEVGYSITYNVLPGGEVN